MKFIMPNGSESRAETVVSENNTAKALGSGSIDVFATPAMIALMEEAANLSTEKHLPEGYISVGIEINVSHLSASGLGEEVYAISKLEKQEGKKLFFSIEAFDSKNKIGKATHIRYIVEESSFMERLNQ